jgi:hypothetical protein
VVLKVKCHLFGSFFKHILKDSPIILLTENFLGLAGLALESTNSRSKALYKAGLLSATDTSQKPTPCDAAKLAPSDSGI